MKQIILPNGVIEDSECEPNLVAFYLKFSKLNVIEITAFGDDKLTYIPGAANA